VKLKMYMRGLGIGIMVTALIMGIATKDGRPLTDAEIKAAAAKLGMVDSNALKLTDLPQDGGRKDSQPGGAEGTPGAEGNPGGTEGISDAKGNSGEAGDKSDGGDNSPGEGENSDGEEDLSGEPEKPDGEEVVSGEGETLDSTETASGEGTTPGGAGEPEAGSNTAGASDPEPLGETIKITVSRGTGSRSVCNQLAEAGLIEDAAAFDQYLIDSGYSKRISAGTFEIPKGASDEEIAKIISKSR